MLCYSVFDSVSFLQWSQFFTQAIYKGLIGLTDVYVFCLKDISVNVSNRHYC